MYTKFKEHWMESQVATTTVSSDEDDNGNAVVSTKKKDIPLWKRLNKDGFTPLTLAAKLGLTDMFSFLLDESKIVQWRYGPVSCVLYPLDELDLEFQEKVSMNIHTHALCVFFRRLLRERIYHQELLN
jgi:hypothetical protein